MLKWILIAAVIVLLFGDRIFGRPLATAARPIYSPNPLYGPTPAPTYASAPPPAPAYRPATNAGDVAVSAIGAIGNVFTSLDPFGWGSDTGDN